MTEHVFGDAADRPHPDGAAGTGPLVGEALRLVSTMQDWALGWAQRGVHDPDGAPTGTDCQWCPLCQAIAVLRGQRPVLTDRVAEAGTALVAALRVLVEAASGPEAHPHGGSRPPAGPRVQKINLGDET